MNVLDVIFALILLSFSITVYKRGFVGEFFSKLAWIGSAIIAFFFSPLFGVNLLKEMTDLKNEPLLYMLAFILLFTISYVAIKAVGALVGNIFTLPIIDNLNKVLGLFLGIIEASIIIAIVIEILLLQSYIPRSVWQGNSKIIPFFIKYVLGIVFLVFC